MIPIHNKIIKSSYNVSLRPTKWENTKQFNIGFSVEYPNFISYKNENFIYFRQDFEGDKKKLLKEVTKRFKIKPNLMLDEDKDFHNGGIHLGRASHNFTVFHDCENNLMGIGGQAEGLIGFIEREQIYNHEDFIESVDYGITFPGYSKVLKPNIFSKDFANGLYLFYFKNNCIERVTKSPIISGLHEGRHDGHYGLTNNLELDKSKGGLSVFDSPTSIVKKDSKYYLYQRANIGTGFRSIQVCSSLNLLKWSPFQIINFNEEFKDTYFQCSIYHPNMFSLKDFIGVFAIIPVSKKNSSNYSDLNSYGDYVLFYSIDYINFSPIGPIFEYIYHKTSVCNGPPIEIDGKKIIYLFNLDGEVSIFKNSNIFLSYCTPNYKSLISKINLEKAIISGEKISIYFSIFLEQNSIKINLINEDNNTEINRENISINKLEANLYKLNANIPIDYLNRPAFISIEFNGINLYSFSGINFLFD